MKILVATPLYPPEIGGPATYVKMLEKHLPKEGFELTVVPFASVRKWPKVIRHVVYYLKLKKLAKDTDIVFALDPVSVGLPAKLAARRTKKSFIVRVPGDYAWEQGQIRFGVTETLDEFVSKKSNYGLFVKLLQRVQLNVAKAATKVIVPSEYMKGVVTTWGVDSENIVPIYSALHPLPRVVNKDEIRRELGLSGTVLISSGRLVPWKGFDALIEILPKIRESISDVSLVIVGDGPEKETLESQVSRLGLTEEVRFVGRLSKSKLAKFLRGSDLFVLNTAYEGLSHQLLEVMDFGVPIVTTRVGGNPELITNRSTGMLIAHNDQDALVESVTTVLQDGMLQESLITNAKQKTEAFEEEKVIEDLMALLQSCTA